MRFRINTICTKERESSTPLFLVREGQGGELDKNFNPKKRYGINIIRLLPNTAKIEINFS
jgi:hypothetical protein